jgi:HD superfamily phosphohydrolase
MNAEMLVINDPLHGPIELAGHEADLVRTSPFNIHTRNPTAR